MRKYGCSLLHLTVRLCGPPQYLEDQIAQIPDVESHTASMFNTHTTWDIFYSQHSAVVSETYKLK